MKVSLAGRIWGCWILKGQLQKILFHYSQNPFPAGGPVWSEKGFKTSKSLRTAPCLWSVGPELEELRQVASFQIRAEANGNLGVLPGCRECLLPTHTYVGWSESLSWLIHRTCKWISEKGPQGLLYGKTQENAGQGQRAGLELATPMPVLPAELVWSGSTHLPSSASLLNLGAQLQKSLGAVGWPRRTPTRQGPSFLQVSALYWGPWQFKNHQEGSEIPEHGLEAPPYHTIFKCCPGWQTCHGIPSP